MGGIELLFKGTRYTDAVKKKKQLPGKNIMIEERRPLRSCSETNLKTSYELVCGKSQIPELKVMLYCW